MNPFKKEYRKFSTLNPEAKKQRFIFNLVDLITYLMSGFAFFEALYLICNMLGSIVCSSLDQAGSELIRVLPALLGYFTLIYIFNTFHSHSRVTNEKRIPLYHRQGITLMILGSLLSLYVIIGWIIGLYHSAVDGQPTSLYPLDFFLLGLLFVLAGAIMNFFVPKIIKDKGLDESFVYEGKPKKLRGLRTFFKVLAMLFSSYGLAVFLLSPFLISWTHGAIFYNLMILAMFILPSVMFVYYRFGYCELKDEYKPKMQRIWSLLFLGITILNFILFIVASYCYPMAGNDNCNGIFPIELTASFNVFPLVCTLVNILLPLIAFLKSLKKNK